MEEFKKSEVVIMDEWKNNLKNGNGDIFDLIERAIMVAASDHPMEFRLKRDKIAQTLFSSCQLISCCDDDHHVEEAQGNVGCKDSNVNNNHQWEWDTINYYGSNHGDTSTEEDLVHEETKMVAEVLKMKEILDKSSSACAGDESIIYSWLSKLQEMDMSFKTLEETKIGRSVCRFQNHGSSDVRQVARTMIKKWRSVVDEHINATQNNTSSCVVHQEEEEPKEKKKEMVSKKELGTSNHNPVKIKIIRRNSSEKAKMDDSQDQMMRMSVISTIEKKLEASKRKLHQRYKEAENAKRQRKSYTASSTQETGPRRPRSQKPKQEIGSKETSDGCNGEIGW